MNDTDRVVMRQLEAPAPAKINLGLHVLRRRPDGYHDLATVFHRIGWADTVRVEPAADGSLSMTCSDPNLPTDEGNLCLQAARALANAYGVEAGARIHLEKRIPYGAGLGGGSSDAATTLRLCAWLWGLDVSPADLRPLARGIGSDVPFFLFHAPTAYATGIGDVLEPMGGQGLEAHSHTLAIVVPPVEVATPKAYGLVTPDDTGRPDLRAIVASGDLARWRRELANDFEGPVVEAYPPVAEARGLLDEAGAAYVSLSGSGAAVFGVFETPGGAREAVEAARDEGWRVWTDMQP
jgi:4-diphosphocytidyl-2-C-methyl-D-erythritol kinase